MENIGCAQPALQCCTLHSLERNHIHLWSNIESNVQNKLKTQGFSSHFGTKVYNSCQYSREIVILYQQNSRKPVFLYIFQGLVQIEAIPHPIASIWLDCFEVETLETSKLQNTVSFGSPLSLPKMENIGCAQPALQCCTLHSLERNHIHLWSNIESNVQNKLKTQGFSSHFGTKVYNSCQFPREIFILYQQNSRKPVFLYIFQGLVQIEAIPHPIASIWLDCFEVETLEKHPNCKTLSRLGLVCLCPKWKTWSCSTCLAMLHTAQFREGSYSFVVKHWVKSSKRVENAGFFFTFWHKSAQFLSISQRNYHTLSAKLKKPVVFAYFPGARSNRSNPTSYSFYLIGLLWSGDLRETSKLQNTVSFGSPLSLPKMENIGCAQPALQCCTLHSLERNHIHLWSNIESNVQNKLKTQGFSSHFGTKVYNSCQYSREIVILYQQNSRKPVFLYIFQGLVQIEAIPHPIASIWLDCFEVETLETSKLQNTVSFGSPLSLPKMENIGCAQPALQCCTLHSLERNHIHLWSNIESNVQNKLKTQGFSSHFGTKVYNSCQFPREIFILYQQNSRKPVFLYIFQGLVQIEAIPHPIASIWLDCFEVETLEKHPNCKTLSRLGLVCLCPKWKTWSCSTCLAMLHTAQFREGSYSFVVKHWVKSSKRVENAGFFFTFWHKSAQFLSISQRNYHTLSAKLKKPVVFAYFPGARSNRSNPTSYSFYLIGLLWSGDLRETSKLQNTVSFGSPLSLPKMENIGCAQPALQCCTLHSLERNHIHLWSNIESNVQNKLKTQGFSSHFGTKVYNSCQYSREIVILYQQNSRKPVFLYIFQGLVQIEAIPHPIASIWLDCFEVETLETSKLQNTVSFGSPLSLPKMENIGCAQPALQCCTLHSLERNHIHLWSNIESNVQNKLKTQGFSSHFGTKVYNSCQFPREIFILYQQNSRKPVFLYIFQGLVQIEAIPHPIASIWLDCFEVETLEKHPNCKTLSRLGLVCLCPKWKTWSCSTCLAMLHTAQFREGSYSFVVKHWVKSSKRVENARFFAHFGTKVHNSCQFPREIIILYQQNSKTPLFLHIFQGLVQIEAIPHPIASIWLDCFEVETLEKHPNCKTLSRLGVVCLCPKWKTVVVLNLPCHAAHCTV